MVCQELILSYVLKIMFIYGNTKVKLQDLLCLSQQAKLGIENWEDKFVGLLNKNQI